MSPVAARGNSGGKRAGTRRGPRQRRTFRPSVLLLALGITLLVIAWGYLVYAAIDFGADARGGDSRAWGFLGICAVGAVACLFAGLMLVARLGRALGITSASPTPPRPRAGEVPSGQDAHYAGHHTGTGGLHLGRIHTETGRSDGRSSTGSDGAGHPTDAPSPSGSHRHRAD